MAGINASGKTTSLKVVSFVIDMLNSKPINDIASNDILRGLGSGEYVQIDSYFYCKNSTLNKLTTIVKKTNDEINRKQKYIISEEKVWSKPVSKIKSKKKMFEFGDGELEVVRDSEADYLLEDVSISMAILKKCGDKKMFFLDILNSTNHTSLNVIGDYPVELIEFLDPSIEWIKYEGVDVNGEESNWTGTIHLKFKGRKEIILSKISEIDNYLSSGTIKGLNIFTNALLTFSSSGYLIIDELENHFNKEIVATLIRLFMNSGVNKNGGTLLFSTHYVELLDEFDRNDGIYILRNREGISADKLSNILDRNDLKKSEVFESGYLGGTAPMYDSYMSLKKYFQHIVRRARVEEK